MGISQSKPVNRSSHALPSYLGQSQTSLQAAEDYWIQSIKKWYPELHFRTYFLPPLHFNRVPYCAKIVAGEQVLVPQIPQDGPRHTSPTTKRARFRSHQHNHVTKALCQCLCVRSVDDALKLSLTSDQLSDVKHNTLTFQWWKQLVSMCESQPLITSTIYEQLVARFCGPATTVEVHCVTTPRLAIRTLGDGVSETGERVAMLALFPQEVDILNQSPSRAFLSGPPGTGKTVVLILQGLSWLRRGHDVHVVSTWDGSRASTIVIQHQLQATMRTTTASSRVHRHQFNFWKDEEVKTAVGHLQSLKAERQLCVIADEAICDYSQLFAKFCDWLIIKVPGVCVWGASVRHEVRPTCLEEFKLTTPLRSPPVIVREVMGSGEIKIHKQVYEYTVSDVPAPTDGPAIMHIKHRLRESGHTEYWPRDCVECGHEIARILTELNVGLTGATNGPPPLQYRDVFVLCVGYPNDDRVDRKGRVISRASGLVRGLREQHIPVLVVEKGDEAAIRDTALGISDLVTVTDCRNVQGLERKVVVVQKRSLDLLQRLQAVSRCTSQLVLINW